MEFWNGKGSRAMILACLWTGACMIPGVEENPREGEHEVKTSPRTLQLGVKASRLKEVETDCDWRIKVIFHEWTNAWPTYIQ